MTEAFFQDGPELENQYESDALLQSYLRRILPPEVLKKIEPDLKRFGGRVAGDILAMGRDAEAHPPVHVPFDPWGRRIDEVRVSQGWKDLEKVAAEEGIVAIGYERKYGALSRVYQFAKLYLYSPSSAIHSCPLAMTDGAARLIEVYGDDTLKQGPYKRLTSRDPKIFWTSGQWMTERTGGSDVGASTTIAKKDGANYRLYGDKWFTSAVTAPVAMTLARLDGALAGGKGLSLFYLEQKDAQGRMNNIRIHRLKDKLGTKALPTAELSLDGTPATLMGGEGDGVKKISTLFNVTRIYNACCAVAAMRRAITLARDYASRRGAFGKKLSELPLHVETLADLQLELDAGFLLTFRTVEVLGKEETKQATPEEHALLRLLTPLAKLYTGKQTVAAASEVLECFGGAGYCEDTGLPALLRDSQTLSIWEGTTNVLALDALRAIAKENSFGPLIADLRKKAENTSLSELKPAVAKLLASAKMIEAYLQNSLTSGKDFLEAGARQFAYALSRSYAAALLLEHADWAAKKEHDPQYVGAALRWCSRDLAPLLNADEAHRQASRQLAMGQPRS